MRQHLEVRWASKAGGMRRTTASEGLRFQPWHWNLGEDVRKDGTGTGVGTGRTTGGALCEGTVKREKPDDLLAASAVVLAETQRALKRKH